jgi:hypothetical protein
MRRILADCCVRAADDQTIEEPAIILMKSRRRIAFPKAHGPRSVRRLQQGFATGEIGFNDQFAVQKS